MKVYSGINDVKGKKLDGLPKNALNAYSELLVDFANCSFVIPANQESNLHRFYKITNKSHLTAVLKNIRDIYLKGKVITVEQFGFFAPMFQEVKSIVGREDDFSRLVLPTVIEDYDT